MNAPQGMRRITRRLARHIINRFDRDLAKAINQIGTKIADSINERTGRDNEQFREELTGFILDYNAAAQIHLDLLITLVAKNGHPLPENLEPAALRTHFTDMCEIAALSVMNEPANPTGMFKNMERNLDAALGAHPSRERLAARQLLYSLLGGNQPSDTAVA